jgi:hypothetical protein
VKAREAVETCHAMCDEFSRASEENKKKEKKKREKGSTQVLLYINISQYIRQVQRVARSGPMRIKDY